MRFAAVNLVLNAGGSVALFFAFKAAGLMPHVGIALATSVAAWVNAAMLWGTLKLRGDFVIDSRLARNIPLIGVASVLMGVGVVAAATLLDPMLHPRSGAVAQAATLAGVVGIGVVLFAAVIIGTGVMSTAQLRRKLKR
jgi:putative peptidoglycan lipid II flippase